MTQDQLFNDATQAEFYALSDEDAKKMRMDLTRDRAEHEEQIAIIDGLSSALNVRDRVLKHGRAA